MFFACLFLSLALLQSTPSVDTVAHEALIDIQTGQYAKAREVLQRALRLAPRNPTLWRYLGAADSRLQDSNAAISAFQKALVLKPQDAQTHFDLGVLYLRQGDTGKALDMYRQGVALDPHDPAANQNYAFLLMKTGKFQDALQPLRELERAQSTDLSVRTALIESLFKSGMAEAGRRELSEFLDLPSATPSDQLALADVLVEDHLPNPAQEVLERTVRSAPRFAEAHAQLGRLLLAEKRYEEAARQSGLAAQLNPASAEYSMQLAEVLLRWKNYHTALAFLTAVNGRFADLPDYQYKLAWAHYGLEHVPNAAGILEKLIQQHPGLDLPHYSLGNCYLALSRLSDAEEQYRTAIRLNPKKASYYAALGQALRKEENGRLDEAILNLDKALQLDPADTQSRLQLAICYEEKGDRTGAQHLLEDVIREEPDFVAAHRVLARLYYREGKREQGDKQKAILEHLDREQLKQHSHLIDSSSARSF